ncbi:peroxisome biogenesis protein 7 [Nicotiana attenuata]|uniref:Peroxisome biogenesis protein 7 n=1 Tax=Nicotiana attenuata TaxID=49451 RepID=A0A1J6I8Z6_NICAT|nr:peroxisome biogenesis protein 7 [Nicotiana attenuata]
MSHLTCMFLEGTNRIVGGRQRKVVKFYRTIAVCGDYEGIVSFRPANVVIVVSGVVSGDFRYGSVWSELKNVNSAVTKDAEILCGGDGDLIEHNNTKVTKLLFLLVSEGTMISDFVCFSSVDSNFAHLYH